MDEKEKQLFQEFYRAYPRKTARADAMKAWVQTKTARPPLLDIIAAIERMMQWRAELAARRDFVPAVPYPATWLRGERWADEFDAPAITATTLEDAALKAWNEIRAASRRNCTPSRWSDPKTAPALSAIGGMNRLLDMRTDQVAFVQRDFVAQYRIATPITSNVVRVQFNQGRAAHG
jgi:hypothetical protein